MLIMEEHLDSSRIRLEQTLASLARKWRDDDSEASHQDLIQVIEGVEQIVSIRDNWPDDRLSRLAAILEQILNDVRSKNMIAIADTLDEQLSPWLQEERRGGGIHDE
jgi:hypothetical protein